MVSDGVTYEHNHNEKNDIIATNEPLYIFMFEHLENIASKTMT